MGKLSDIKVGDIVRFHGGIARVVQRTRGAEQLLVRVDGKNREVWITDARFWFERGELEAVDDGFNRD